jgi:hypothetical protein
VIPSSFATQTFTCKININWHFQREFLPNTRKDTSSHRLPPSFTTSVSPVTADSNIQFDLSSPSLNNVPMFKYPSPYSKRQDLRLHLYWFNTPSHQAVKAERLLSYRYPFSSSKYPWPTRTPAKPHHPSQTFTLPSSSHSEDKTQLHSPASSSSSNRPNPAPFNTNAFSHVITTLMI